MKHNSIDGEVLKLLLGDDFKADINLDDYVLVPKEKIMHDEVACEKMQEEFNELKARNEKLVEERNQDKNKIIKLHEDLDKATNNGIDRILSTFEEIQSQMVEVSKIHNEDSKLSHLDEDLKSIMDQLQELDKLNKITHEKMDDGFPCVIEQNNELKRRNNDIVKQGNAIVGGINTSIEQNNDINGRIINTANSLYTNLENYHKKANKVLTQDITKEVKKAAPRTQLSFD